MRETAKDMRKAGLPAKEACEQIVRKAAGWMGKEERLG
jgi:hypothetical protein